MSRSFEVLYGGEVVGVVQTSMMVLDGNMISFRQIFEPVDPELQAEEDSSIVDDLESAAEDAGGVTMHLQPSMVLAACRRVRALEAECDRLFALTRVQR